MIWPGEFLLYPYLYKDRSASCHSLKSRVPKQWKRESVACKPQHHYASTFPSDLTQWNIYIYTFADPYTILKTFPRHFDTDIAVKSMQNTSITKKYTAWPRVPCIGLQIAEWLRRLLSAI